MPYVSLNPPKLLAEWLTQKRLNKCVMIDGLAVDFPPAHLLCCCQKNLSQGLFSLHNSSGSLDFVRQHYCLLGGWYRVGTLGVMKRRVKKQL